MLCNDNRVSSKSQVSLLKTFLMSKAQRVMLFPSYSKVQEREGLALSLCRIWASYKNTCSWIFFS